MKRAIFASLCCYLCTTVPATAAGPDLNELFAPSDTVSAHHTVIANTPCVAFNELNSLIRDNKISKNTARTELAVILAKISTEYYQRGGKDYSAADWVFPVAGYSAAAIEKRGNHGFVASGYNFFSGNLHGGHPAYDIFIRDRNQDSRDDRNGKAVAVRSMTGGIVVALEKEWHQGSKLRGGKYIWVYDPANNLLVYYAHNEELLVELGTIIKPGDLLASMGRSGLNAAKRRSPTHLHFSVLKLVNGKPLPLPLYQELQRAKDKALQD